MFFAHIRDYIQHVEWCGCQFREKACAVARCVRGGDKYYFCGVLRQKTQDCVECFLFDKVCFIYDEEIKILSTYALNKKKEKTNVTLSFN